MEWSQAVWQPGQLRAARVLHPASDKNASNAARGGCYGGSQ